MHAATLERSPRLQRVQALLANGRWHSTREIMPGANVCAVNSCVSELRANGFEIECQQQVCAGERLFFYKLVREESSK